MEELRFQKIHYSCLVCFQNYILKGKEIKCVFDRYKINTNTQLQLQSRNSTNIASKFLPGRVADPDSAFKKTGIRILQVFRGVGFRFNILIEASRSKSLKSITTSIWKEIMALIWSGRIQYVLWLDPFGFGFEFLLALDLDPDPQLWLPEGIISRG